MSPLWRPRSRARPAQRLWDPARPGPSLLETVAEGATGEAPLPDDPASAGVSTFAPGALSAISARHTLPTGDGRGQPAVRAVVAALDLHTRSALDRATLLAMYEALVDDDSRVQPVLTQAVAAWAQATAARAGPTTETAITRAVRQVGGWLVLTGAQRGPVRTGINLVSMLTDLGGLATSVATLGRHVELSLEASTALSRAGPGCEPLLLEVARGHTGWGRVHAVEHLSRSADRTVRTWLLSGGFRNDVRWEYTACEVCVRCDLAGRLAELEGALGAAAPASGERPDRELTSQDVELLDGARDLLVTLLSTTSPSGDVEDYADTATAVSAWLRLTAARDAEALVVQDLHAALRLWEAVRDDPRLSEANGFTARSRSSVRDLCVTLLAEPSAVDTVLAAQDGADRRSSAAATAVAVYLGIDLTGALLARVRADPDDPQGWWLLARAASARPDEVVRAALELLPEDVVARDSRATIGPAPGPHLAVGIVLQELLTGRPGLGWPLLERCLRSPLVGPRNQAVTVLLSWPRQEWPAACVRTLHEMRETEQDPALRTRIAEVLAGMSRPGQAESPA